ncbi:MAG: hypothetical protein AAF191_18010, partial [Verrucomicrobiota bacterium]
MKSALRKRNRTQKLDHLHPSFFDRLSGWTRSRLSVRRREVQLSTEVSLQPPLHQDQTLLYPEAGLAISKEGVLAAHAVEAGSTQSVELEFDDELSSLTLAPAGDPAKIHFESFREDFFSHEVSGKAYQEWKERRLEDWKLCPCCVQRAFLRAQFPRKQVLYRIFEQRAESGKPFLVRLKGPHLDFHRELTIQRLSAEEGTVRLGDSSSLLEIRFFYIHALGLKREM